jgi:ATP-binding cassette subfamily B protein
MSDVDPVEPAAPAFWPNIRMLFSIMGRRRRLQFVAALVLTFLGSIAELVTIGAVLPLLAVAAGGASYAAKIPGLNGLLGLFGGAEGGSSITPAAILLVIAAIGAAALRLTLTWLTQNFVYGLLYDLTMRVFGRVIRQPYSLFVKQNSSQVVSGIEKIYFVAVGVVSPLITAITSAMMGLFIIAFLFFIDPATAAIAAVTMGLLYVAITLVTRRLVFNISRRAAIIRTNRIKLLQESLGGLRDIILDRSEEAFERRLAIYEREMQRLQAQSNIVATSPRFIVEGAGITLVAMLSIYFSMQAGGILAALPVLGALALGAQRLLPLLQAVYVGWANYAVHAHTLRDVVALLNTPVSPDRTHPRDAAAAPFRDRIELRNVSFSYDDKHIALKKIDLTIAKGERVGLIGKTGSGKSTLVDLLMGLLRPSDGEMMLDGVRVDDERVGSWQAQIAHVPQAIFLADDSIAANIAFGSDETIDLDRVWEAAEQADIADFIRQLPEGMMTAVGERGVRLSGGQRVRIGIARALYKKATVLILDEATSALDDNTEAAVMESVAGLGRDLTMILIAHRLSTVAGCDTIYRLDAGRVNESGNYDEVVLRATARR